MDGYAGTHEFPNIRAYNQTPASMVLPLLAGVITYPCGLLITELLTNTFKYAFSDGKHRPITYDCEIAVSAGSEFCGDTADRLTTR